MYRLFIALLFSFSIYAAELETSVYNAIMAYETPSRIKSNIEKSIKRKLGQEMTLAMTVLYNTAKNQSIDIPFKTKGSYFIFHLKEESASINFSRSF